MEAEICRIAVRNIVSAGRMLGARKRGLGGRGGRRQAVSAAFIAFSNRGPPKSEAAGTASRHHAPAAPDPEQGAEALWRAAAGALRSQWALVDHYQD